MKRAVLVLCCVLFAVTALLPLGTVILLCFGCSMTLFSVPVFAIGLAVLSVCVVVLDFVVIEIDPNKTVRILLALLLPLSLINGFWYLYVCGRVFVFGCGAACVVCAFILTIKYAKPLWLKITAFVLSALLAGPIGLFSFFALFPIGQNTVVQTVASPSGKYYAEVIRSDQGALGGDTLVNVCANWEINLLLLKIEKKPQRVYLGDWGEFEDMQIHWKDDGCIVISSVEYKIG